MFLFLHRRQKDRLGTLAMKKLVKLLKKIFSQWKQSCFTVLFQFAIKNVLGQLLPNDTLQNQY